MTNLGPKLGPKMRNLYSEILQIDFTQTHKMMKKVIEIFSQNFQQFAIISSMLCKILRTLG